MWGNTVAIHVVLKKKNYKAKFLISSILKKINSTKIILEKIIQKRKHKNKTCEETS
jgi:ABC-type sulfate transport system permease subunit